MGDIIRQRVRYGGGSGSGLPDGGTTGQALVKKSDANQDVEWADLVSEEEVKHRAVGYKYDVDKHFVAPGLNLSYSGIQEVLPGPQIDLEFWDMENFPPDFDMDDPSTWPEPIKVYTGSALDDNLTFTINGVVGQYNAARHTLDIDLSTFPEYDPQNENGTLYIHGRMVKKIDPELLPSVPDGNNQSY